MNAESAGLWQRFVSHAERARAKPTFDAEERERKIEVAAQLQDAFALARDGGEWLPALKSALQTGLHINLTVIAHRTWLRKWADADPESLRPVLAAFLDPEAGAEERFEAFAVAAEQAGAGRAPGPPPGAVLALGSTLNFATAPEALPLVRPWLFEKLEEILGFELPVPAGEPASYPQHLAFARQVRSQLEGSGLAVRDMIDVQSLIFIAAHEHSFWAGRRTYVTGAPPPPERLDTGRDAGLDARPYLSICAVYRNEAPYLREWIEFHRLAGVEHFFLYNNLSTDAHREMLAPYVDGGLVTIRDWDAAPLDQRQTYDHCLDADGARSRWIAFIDIDEFLFSPTGRPLPEVLEEYEQWPGVGVNWACFGSSGHETKPSGLVIENYLMRVDAPANRFIKSIVDPARVIRCASAHHFIYDSLITIDENHYPIAGARSKSVSFSRLRINHYVTKSDAEARAKLNRGAGWEHSRRWRSSRLEDSYPQSIDRTITAYLPALEKALEAVGERSQDRAEATADPPPSTHRQ